MNLKLKLQRTLQILEESERVGALSYLERDIILNDLREAYAELKYSDERRESKVESRVCEINSPTTPIAPITSTEEVKSEPAVEKFEPETAEEHEPEVETDDEPEVEVELIFDEESEEAENEELKAENEEQESEVVQNEEQSENTPITPNVPIVEDNLSSLASRLSSNKRSPLLSLYEDAPTPVLGEQFHENPSVADTIACPKGVAESAPVVSLRDAIGVADKFMLIRELFGGDADAYDKAIDALEVQSSFDDCIIFIAEHYAWSPNSQATKLVMDLLQRKYK